LALPVAGRRIAGSRAISMPSEISVNNILLLAVWALLAFILFYFFILSALFLFVSRSKDRESG
jgi:hypothetical protein